MIFLVADGEYVSPITKTSKIFLITVVNFHRYGNNPRTEIGGNSHAEI